MQYSSPLKWIPLGPMICSEVSLAQGLVVNHTPPTVVAIYDKGRQKKNRIDERSVD